jgi:hypothetical protein
MKETWTEAFHIQEVGVSNLEIKESLVTPRKRKGSSFKEAIIEKCRVTRSMT